MSREAKPLSGRQPGKRRVTRVRKLLTQEFWCLVLNQELNDFFSTYATKLTEAEWTDKYFQELNTVEGQEETDWMAR